MTRAAGVLHVPPSGDVWLFAYGSLMWNAAFDFAERRPAQIRGWHRSFCVLSTVYRGTPEKPGLALGLDRGGACNGIAFRISEAQRTGSLAAIAEQELQEEIYICRDVRIATGSGPVAGQALTVNRTDTLYAGRLSPDETARRIATCEGERGPNIDYLRNTVAHLEDMNIRDRGLSLILRLAEGLRAETGQI